MGDSERFSSKNDDVFQNKFSTNKLERSSRSCGKSPPPPINNYNSASYNNLSSSSSIDDNKGLDDKHVVLLQHHHDLSNLCRDLEQHKLDMQRQHSTQQLAALQNIGGVSSTNKPLRVRKEGRDEHGMNGGTTATAFSAQNRSTTGGSGGAGDIWDHNLVASEDLDLPELTDISNSIASYYSGLPPRTIPFRSASFSQVDITSDGKYIRNPRSPITLKPTAFCYMNSNSYASGSSTLPRAHAKQQRHSHHPHHLPHNTNSLDEGDLVGGISSSTQEAEEVDAAQVQQQMQLQSPSMIHHHNYNDSDYSGIIGMSHNFPHHQFVLPETISEQSLVDPSELSSSGLRQQMANNNKMGDNLNIGCSSQSGAEVDTSDTSISPQENQNSSANPSSCSEKRVNKVEFQDSLELPPEQTCFTTTGKPQDKELEIVEDPLKEKDLSLKIISPRQNKPQLVRSPPLIREESIMARSSSEEGPKSDQDDLVEPTSIMEPELPERNILVSNLSTESSSTSNEKSLPSCTRTRSKNTKKHVLLELDLGGGGGGGSSISGSGGEDDPDKGGSLFRQSSGQSDESVEGDGCTSPPITTSPPPPQPSAHTTSSSLPLHHRSHLSAGNSPLTEALALDSPMRRGSTSQSSTSTSQAPTAAHSATNLHSTSLPQTSSVSGQPYFGISKGPGGTDPGSVENCLVGGGPRESDRINSLSSPNVNRQQSLMMMPPRRYNKRPLRGPYGQMLEAEMNKVPGASSRNAKDYYDNFEFWRESKSSSPSRTTSLQNDSDSGVGGGGGGGVGGGVSSIGSATNNYLVSSMDDLNLTKQKHSSIRSRKISANLPVTHYHAKGQLNLNFSYVSVAGVVLSHFLCLYIWHFILFDNKTSHKLMYISK